MRNRRILRFTIAFIAVVLAGVLAGVIVGDKVYLNEVIPKGSHIGRINVGGKTLQKAMDIISTMDADAVVTESLSFVYQQGDEFPIRYEFKPSQAGIVIDINRTIENAGHAFTRKNLLERLLLSFKKKKPRINPALKVGNDDKLKVFMAQLAEYIDSDPVDARFVIVPMGDGKKKKHQVVASKDQEGRVIDRDRSMDSLKRTLEEGKQQTKLIVITKAPAVTRKMLLQIPDPEVIGSYTTYYGNHDSPNRIHNIYLVASFIDNTYIPSGEVFSLLKPVGEFTGERGFKEAYVIIGDELVPEYGGGTCQIATTLYNTVMMADIEVLRRANHGMYFAIYPLGRDAAVYPPYTDFRFRNDTGYPVVIQAVPFRRGLTIKIIGQRTGKTVTFTYPKRTVVPTRITTFEVGSDTPVTKTIMGPGFRTEVVRTVKLNGKIIKKEKIKSYYKMHGDNENVKIRRKEPR